MSKEIRMKIKIKLYKQRKKEKIKIYKQIKVKGVKYKQAIEAEKFIHPDFTDLAIFKDEKGNGIILDIKTGLVFAIAKWKKQVIEVFNDICADIYCEHIKTEYYQKEIKEFNELEEYHPEVKKIK